jgi:hypothetical protein
MGALERGVFVGIRSRRKEQRKAPSGFPIKGERRKKEGERRGKGTKKRRTREEGCWIANCYKGYL